MLETDILIETIYEASVVPEHWPNVLKSLAEYSGCKGGMLVANPQRPDVRWVASENLVAPMTAYARDGWATRNPKPGRLANLRHPGFVCDSDLFTLHELENEPLYVELSRPHGFWFSVGTMITVPTGDLLVFDIQRAYGRPPIEREAVDRLDGVRPHLARAAAAFAQAGGHRPPHRQPLLPADVPQQRSAAAAGHFDPTAAGAWCLRLCAPRRLVLA
ncbi:MAG: hypothetical protein HC900_06955 [Methylacidiphilales bacterium]|nr:hypothetical protein [Candidatus Methylacidiphilales bacterium]